MPESEGNLSAWHIAVIIPSVCRQFWFLYIGRGFNVNKSGDLCQTILFIIFRNRLLSGDFRLFLSGIFVPFRSASVAAKELCRFLFDQQLLKSTFTMAN